MASPANEPTELEGEAAGPTSKERAQRQERASWRSWTYLEWNEELLKYCFLAGDGANAVPVTRLAASAGPEELTRLRS